MATPIESRNSFSLTLEFLTFKNNSDRTGIVFGVLH